MSGGVLIPFALAVKVIPPGMAVLAFALCFGGELLERYLFFHVCRARQNAWQHMKAPRRQHVFAPMDWPADHRSCSLAW